MQRLQWLSQRKRYIGSSDSAGILGCGYSNQSRRSVWQSKVNNEKQEFSKETEELMAQGTANEPLVIEAFRVRNPQYLVVSEEFDLRVNERYPNLCASLDAYGKDGDEEFPVEAKWIMNPSRKVGDEWVNEWDSGQCPLMYQFQALHQMIVTGARRGVVVAFVRGEYMERWIEWDQNAVDWMLSEYEQFWRHVESETVPPEPASLIGSVRDVVVGTAKIVGSETSEIIREIALAQKKIAQMQQRVDVLLRSVGKKIDSAEYVMLDDGTAAKIYKSSVRIVAKLPRGVKVAS